MSISEKIKAVDSKIEQNKAQDNLTGKLLRFLLYHWKMLVSTNFWQTKMFYKKKTC